MEISRTPLPVHADRLHDGRAHAETLGVTRAHDHKYFIARELGVGHPHEHFNATDEEMFNVQKLSAFEHKKIKGSFNKTKCEGCGEYVFDRYVSWTANTCAYPVLSTEP